MKGKRPNQEIEPKQSQGEIKESHIFINGILYGWKTITINICGEIIDEIKCIKYESKKP